MTSQLQFLFSSLVALGKDTALLEMFDWNEDNLENFKEEVARAFTLHEMSSPEALIDFLVETAKPNVVEFMLPELENLMRSLVENSIQEIIDLETEEEN